MSNRNENKIFRLVDLQMRYSQHRQLQTVYNKPKKKKKNINGALLLKEPHIISHLLQISPGPKKGCPQAYTELKR